MNAKRLFWQLTRNNPAWFLQIVELDEPLSRRRKGVGWLVQDGYGAPIVICQTLPDAMRFVQHELNRLWKYACEEVREAAR